MGEGALILLTGRDKQKESCSTKGSSSKLTSKTLLMMINRMYIYISSIIHEKSIVLVLKIYTLTLHLILLPFVVSLIASVSCHFQQDIYPYIHRLSL